MGGMNDEIDRELAEARAEIERLTEEVRRMNQSSTPNYEANVVAQRQRADTAERERDEIMRERERIGNLCGEKSAEIERLKRERDEARAQLVRREFYLEMVIEAFLIQYGPEGVAEWAIEEARAARGEGEGKRDGDA